MEPAVYPIYAVVCEEKEQGYTEEKVCPSIVVADIIVKSRVPPNFADKKG